MIHQLIVTVFMGIPCFFFCDEDHTERDKNKLLSGGQDM